MTEEVTGADLPHVRRCAELATQAVEAGDFPFGRRASVTITLSDYGWSAAVTGDPLTV